MALLTDYELVAGTYEEFVIGYKINRKMKTKDEYEFSQTFTQRAHVGPVRSLSTVNKFLVSGGSDEVCKIFNMVDRVEHGQLVHHDGTVACLEAHGRNYLFSASDDNSLAITKVGSWQIEKTLYKHQAGITALAVHPTGKIAFSAGKDKKLITWNLVKARPAFITNLHGIAEFITVSPDGNRYCVGIHRRIDIYSVELAGIEYSIDMKCRPNAMAFLDNSTVAIGGESSKIQIHSLIEKKLINEFEAHSTRVRCLKVLRELDANSSEDADKEEGSPKSSVLVSASSSDGMLKMWRIFNDDDSETKCIGSVDTTCRVTCLTSWHAGMRGSSKKKKRKAVESTDQATVKKRTKFAESPSKAAEKSSEEITVEETISEKKLPKNPSAKIKKKKQRE